MADTIVHKGTYMEIRVVAGRGTTLCKDRVRVQFLVETVPVCDLSSGANVDARFVVDCSSSMRQQSGDGENSKIELVRNALFGVEHELRGEDFAMLASFSSEAKLRCPHRRMGQFFPTQRTLKSAIKRLDTSWGTHISEALEMGLKQSVAGPRIPRVFLFTDGQSTVRQDEDNKRLVELADIARGARIPVAIYGTGIEYNWSLLQQFAIRAGNGSFCKHVLNVGELRDHLTGELAFMRGVAITDLSVLGYVQGVSVPQFDEIAARGEASRRNVGKSYIEVVAGSPQAARSRIREQTQRGVEVVGVTVMTPTIRRLEEGRRDGGSNFTQDGFSDLAGNLDVHRGQQYLIELEVRSPRPGSSQLMNLRFSGKTLDDNPVSQDVSLSASFTNDPNKESVVDERVRNVYMMLNAARVAENGDFERAERLFREAGGNESADAMQTFIQECGRFCPEEVRRASGTIVGESVSMSLAPQATRVTKGDK